MATLQEDLSNLVSPKVVARLLGQSVETIRLKVARGELPAQQGRFARRPVPALQPRTAPPDRIHQGEQGADRPDRRPGLLERVRAPHPRLGSPAERVPIAAAK